MVAGRRVAAAVAESVWCGRCRSRTSDVCRRKINTMGRCSPSARTIRRRSRRPRSWTSWRSRSTKTTRTRTGSSTSWRCEAIASKATWKSNGTCARTRCGWYSAPWQHWGRAAGKASASLTREATRVEPGHCGSKANRQVSDLRRRLLQRRRRLHHRPGLARPSRARLQERSLRRRHRCLQAPVHPGHGRRGALPGPPRRMDGLRGDLR